jgi:hypothetical protein
MEYLIVQCDNEMAAACLLEPLGLEIGRIVQQLHILCIEFYDIWH